MDNSEQDIASPCVNLCGYDEQKICQGCFRSQDEISAWGGASNEDRRNIIRNSEQRRVARS